MRLGAFTITCMILSMSAAVNAAADDAKLPIGFCRSGRQATVRVAAEHRGEVVLRAFGRTWSKPAMPKKGRVRVSVPPVRVPTLFQVATLRPGFRSVAELVAYPKDVSIKWPTDSSVIVADTSPDWLREWIAAVGLPFDFIDLTDEAALRKRKSPASRPTLLVVGRVAAGANPDAVTVLCRKQGWNLVVIDAAWFGRRNKRVVSISPKQMLGEFVELHTQRWPRPLQFSASVGPWPLVANRRSWIQHDQSSFLEEIDAPYHDGRIVLSYVPWEQQLGRNEIADVLFVELLRSAARPAKPMPVALHIEWLWPKVDQITDESRPVAFAAVKGRDLKPAIAPKHSKTRLWILDLRGKVLGDKEADSIRIPTLKAAHDRLLVLGVDPNVAKGRWSGKPEPKPDIFARKRKATAADERVLWLKDDALPASESRQIALMQTFTRLGVKLAPVDKHKEQNHVHKKSTK